MCGIWQQERGLGWVSEWWWDRYECMHKYGLVYVIKAIEKGLEMSYFGQI